MRSAIRLPVLLLVLSQLACGDDDINRIDPVLAVENASPDTTDAAEWIVDFGQVAVGTTHRRAVVVANVGKSTLTVGQLEVAPPFEAFLARYELKVSERLTLEFAFTPADEGLAEQVVTIGSDGGETKVRLIGIGVPGAGCQLSASPLAIDFGTVQIGQQLDKKVALVNNGGRTCRVEKLGFAARSEAAYSLVGAPAGTFDIDAHAQHELTVRFRPLRDGGPQLGAVEVTLHHLDALRVQLTAMASEPCPGQRSDGTCPVAADSVYVNTTDQLYSYAPDTGVATLIGTFKQGSKTIDAMTDIAIDTGGAMLGVRAGKDKDTNRDVKELYRIDPTTAAVNKIANITGIGDSHLNGLTFLGDGRLILAGDAVWEIDRATGAVSRTLVQANSPWTTAGDIIALPDGFLYWTVRNLTPNGNDQLVRIDADKGFTQLVGTTGEKGIFGLGYGNNEFGEGTLYGFSSDKTSFVISPKNAATSGSRRTDGAWWGATTNPVLWDDE